MSQNIGTVCFIISGNKVLLAEIEYPDGQLLWNGIGGVVDPGETPEKAVVREISEETELIVSEADVAESGTINVGNVELHVFTVQKYSGELETIDPTLKQLKWFDFDKVPYAHMHPNNDKWLPQILDKARI